MTKDQIDKVNKDKLNYPAINDHVYQRKKPTHTLCVLEIVTPQRPDFVLTANIPHGKADVLVFYSFDIES